MRVFSSRDDLAIAGGLLHESHIIRTVRDCIHYKEGKTTQTFDGVLRGGLDVLTEVDRRKGASVECDATWEQQRLNS